MQSDRHTNIIRLRLKAKEKAAYAAQDPRMCVALIIITSVLVEGRLAGLYVRVLS